MGQPDPTSDPVRSTGTRAHVRARRAGDGRRRRTPAVSRAFRSTYRALDDLVRVGAEVSVHVRELDRGTIILGGDDFVTLPVGGLGVVPLLVEVAAQIETGALTGLEIIERGNAVLPEGPGLWSHLAAPALPLLDLAVLTAATGDVVAANLLIDHVGLLAVRRRTESLGLSSTALLDRFRRHRGPDDAPQVALSATRELATVFAALLNSAVVSPWVSTQVAEWLSLGQDLSLVGAATGLDPFAHEADRHGLLFVNKTGRADGVRAEAGVMSGPRGGVAYAIIVRFEDDTVSARLRVHDAFRQFGLELMELVY